MHMPESSEAEMVNCHVHAPADPGSGLGSCATEADLGFAAHAAPLALCQERQGRNFWI